MDAAAPQPLQPSPPLMFCGVGC